MGEIALVACTGQVRGMGVPEAYGRSMCRLSGVHGTVAVHSGAVVVWVRRVCQLHQARCASRYWRCVCGRRGLCGASGRTVTWLPPMPGRRCSRGQRGSPRDRSGVRRQARQPRAPSRADGSAFGFGQVRNVARTVSADVRTDRRAGQVSGQRCRAGCHMTSFVQVNVYVEGQAGEYCKIAPSALELPLCPSANPSRFGGSLTEADGAGQPVAEQLGSIRAGPPLVSDDMQGGPGRHRRRRYRRTG
jgi:hypothetical protein